MLNGHWRKGHKGQVSRLAYFLNSSRGLLRCFVVIIKLRKGSSSDVYPAPHQSDRGPAAAVSSSQYQVAQCQCQWCLTARLTITIKHSQWCSESIKHNFRHFLSSQTCEVSSARSPPRLTHHIVKTNIQHGNNLPSDYSSAAKYFLVPHSPELNASARVRWVMKMEIVRADQRTVSCLYPDLINSPHDPKLQSSPVTAHRVTGSHRETFSEV